MLLASCGLVGEVASAPPPLSPPASVSAGPIVTAPLRATQVDERAIRLAYDSAEVLLTAVDALVAVRAITPGSPQALAIARKLRRVKAALNAAQLAQRAGNATSYEAAIRDAQAAFGDAKAALQEIRR
jgi:hypothetical protein